VALAGRVWSRQDHPARPTVAAPSVPQAAPAPAPTDAPAEPTALPIPSAAPVAAPEPPPRLELDPLLALLAEQDPQHLIASAHPKPAEGLLVLTMKPTYTDLAAASRGRWAERWQERALELGYERLELVNGRQRLLARAALVGSGMILLDPGPPG